MHQHLHINMCIIILKLYSCVYIQLVAIYVYPGGVMGVKRSPLQELYRESLKSGVVA